MELELAVEVVVEEMAEEVVVICVGAVLGGCGGLGGYGV